MSFAEVLMARRRAANSLRRDGKEKETMPKACYANLEENGGILVPLHSLEPGGSCPRRKGEENPDIIVVHYTACQNLPRRQSKDRTCELLNRAKDRGMVSFGEVALAKATARSFVDQVPDALAQGAIAATTEREACAHFYVASWAGVLTSGSTDAVARTMLGSSTIVVPVVEFVSPARVAHHVGPLTGHTNRRSIGIEFCYPGPAPRREGIGVMRHVLSTEEDARSWYRARGWECPRPWSKSVCLDGVSRWFAPVPPLPLSALVGLCADLCLVYPTIKALCSHHEFAPKKRIDPDPPISLRELAARVGVLAGRRLAIVAPTR